MVTIVRKKVPAGIVGDCGFPQTPRPGGSSARKDTSQPVHPPILCATDGGEVIVERGVVVGGLMICGSFLLAASLNRSAVKEAQPAESPAAEAPITPPLPAVSVDEPKPEACAPGAKGENEPVVADQPAEGDLPGNGRKACSQ